MLYIHLFPPLCAILLPISCCHSYVVPLCQNRAVCCNCPVDDQHHLSDTGSSCVSWGDRHVVFVFVHHLLCSSVIVMNIRYCRLSQLSLFLWDLQSIPNYLIVKCPVGTLSKWAYVICVAVLRAHILEVVQSHACTCDAGFVIFPCFCAGNSVQLRVQTGDASWREQQNEEGLCKPLKLTGSPCLLLLTHCRLLWVLWIAVRSVVL